MTTTPFTSFAFPGTGSSASRTTPQRIADIFNVKEYGATGGGSIDDTAAINAAVTAASNNGIIFFPKGTYKVTSAVIVPSQSSLIFQGEGSGSVITGNFNGFLFDNLSNPPGGGSAISIIEQLHLSNTEGGNNFTATANGTWAQSASPVSITLSGSNPGIAAGGALFVLDQRFSANSVFIGMITSVASWPTVTVSSTARSSAAGLGGETSNLAMRVVQCYAAGASWVNGASTITMATTPPAGISGQYYIYDYERVITDPKYNKTVGVGTWSGTTLTFTAGSGAVGGSDGSSDRLWFAPVAGCIRYSSVVGATVRDCTIGGFIGVTSSQDRIVDLGGAEQGFEITVERCNIVNPTGFSAVVGQTGINLQNNSLAYYNSFNSAWCAIRLSGTTCSAIGGRIEVGWFGIILDGDYTGSINSLGNAIIASISLESNLLGLYAGAAGELNINTVGVICNALFPIGGMYFTGNSYSVIQNSGATGNFGTGNAIYVGDPGGNAGRMTFIGCSAVNNNNTALNWRLPAQAWWGTCIQCDNPKLVYTFANLPTGTSSPTPVEGDEYNISDGAKSGGGSALFGDTVVGSGSQHIKARYNGTIWTRSG